MAPQKPVTNGYFSFEDTPDANEAHQLENMEDNLGSTEDHPMSSPDEDDFAEYLWMENEEEFDQQVLRQLEEEELTRQCMEAMMEDEQNNLMAERMQNSNGSSTQNVINNFKLDLIDIANSTLNPLAAEFVPNDSRQSDGFSTNRE